VANRSSALHWGIASIRSDSGTGCADCSRRADDAVDLRRGFDGLSATTRTVIGADPLSGHVFCFLNRRRDRIKLLIWDRTGFLLVYKRLFRGTSSLPSVPRPGSRHVEVDAGELALMLEGIDLRGARRQGRWTLYLPATATSSRGSQRSEATAPCALCCARASPARRKSPLPGCLAYITRAGP
jgi:transposase